MKTWRDKAKEMINIEAQKQYKLAGNPTKNGKHKPYTLPKWCDELVECLNSDNEEKAKAIFNWQFLRDY